MSRSELGSARYPRSDSKAEQALQTAQHLAEEGNVSEAIDTLERAMVMGADRYMCYLQLAMLYRMSEQWGNALQAAKSAVAVAPDRELAWEAIIALCLQTHDYVGVVRASKDLLRISPRHVTARNALGAAYIGMGDVTAAMRVINDLIRLAPQDALHRFRKALLCEHQGAFRLAVEEFERVLAMDADTGIANAAREQLDLLDTHQLSQILTLADADPVFRIKLRQDPIDAAEERGYFLSDSGCHMLRDWLLSTLSSLPTDGTPVRYQ